MSMTDRYLMFLRNTLKLYLIGAVLFFSLARASENAEDTSCNANAIPDFLSTKMKSSFIGWRIKNLGDFDEFNRAAWVKAKPSLCPGIASGHFINSQAKDYALLLVPKDQKNQSYKIVVFSLKGEKVNSLALERGRNKFVERIAVSSIPPGKYSGAEDSPTVELKTDGIVVEALEAGSIIYYWSNGRFRKIIASE